jgi:hypothetical protein
MVLMARRVVWIAKALGEQSQAASQDSATVLRHIRVRKKTAFRVLVWSTVRYQTAFWIFERRTRSGAFGGVRQGN